MAVLSTIGDSGVAGRVESSILKSGSDTKGVVFKASLILATGFALLMLLVLLQYVLSRAWPILTERPGDFVSSELRVSPAETGVFQPLRGTFWIGVFVVALAFPIGIGAAVYLEEYARDTKLTRFININIRNLAGVPSVVYGILGFSIFVKAMNGFFPGSVGVHNGKTTAAAGVTLAVLALPIVIITASEAIRSVPRALREGGFGVGATKSQVIRTQVLPYAAPGILTGTLLSLARALGEAAPLILVGAIQGRLGYHTGFFGLSQLGENFTALPIAITNFAKNPGGDWERVSAAAIVILLIVVLMANAAAVLLRNRFERKRG